MYRYVAITLFFVTHFRCIRDMPSPLRVTIDCSDEKPISKPWLSRTRQPEIYSREDRFDVNSFCNIIHNAVPKAVKNGRFILIGSEADQAGLGDTIAPVSIAPPKEFLSKSVPRFKKPKLKIPKISVPILQPQEPTPLAPRVASKHILSPRYKDEESSAAKIEILKKGIQKMLHFVKVLGKIDQYLTERARIIIEKLSKTFSD